MSLASSIQLLAVSAFQSESITTSWSRTLPSGEAGMQGAVS